MGYTSAPAILFSPASMALSEAGGSFMYSAPRGMVACGVLGWEGDE